MCVWRGKDIALASYHSLFYFVWFYALSVLGNFIRDSLLPNNDVDPFAQKYLRWDSEKCNKTPHQYFMLVSLNINQTLMYCNKTGSC